jgi:hypothetical protein
MLVLQAYSHNQFLIFLGMTIQRTDSDYGIDAISGFGQYITGRVGGTLSLAPITSLKPI